MSKSFRVISSVDAECEPDVSENVSASSGYLMTPYLLY